MRMWGVFAGIVLVFTIACSGRDSEESVSSVDAVDTLGSGTDGTAEVERDDPRTQLRGALIKLGHADDVPEDASRQELEALVDEKVANGAIPKEHAEKLLKVLESAQQHNERLEQLDQRLFGDNAY